MQTPHRKPLRPVNRNTPSSAPHPSNSFSSATTKPNRTTATATTTKPSRIPSLTPHNTTKHSHTRHAHTATTAEPPADQENRPPHATTVLAAAASPRGGRRVRRQVMRLSELAAVRMTPIKEREEEEGLGEAKVAIDCCIADGSARKRTVEQQEEEIRQWEAMLRAEGVERRGTPVRAAADCFHTASELEFELTELQQLGVVEDDRRSSMFAALPVLTFSAAGGDDERANIADSEQETVATESVQLPLHMQEVDEFAMRMDDSEIEMQKRGAAAQAAETNGSSLDAPRDAILSEVIELAADAMVETSCIDAVQSDHVADVASASDHCGAHEGLDETCTEALQCDDHRSEVKCSDVAHVSTEQIVDQERAECGGGCLDESVILPSNIPPLLCPLPPSEFEPSPNPSCIGCSSLLASLQKEDHDYDSLYFAYCQLERQYNALKVKQPTESEAEGVDQAEDEQEEGVDTETSIEAVDYAAMVEEKIVASQSPEPSLIEELSAQLHQLKVDKAAAEAQQEADRAAAQAEAAELRGRYEQLQADYVSQSEQLIAALATVENSKGTSTQLEEISAMSRAEQDGIIDQAKACIARLEITSQSLTIAVHTQQQETEQLHVQLAALDAERLRLMASLASQQLEAQQLHVQLSDQRDTTEYVQNEKLAVDQELSDLHTAHNALLTQQTADRLTHEAQLAQQQHKDADMLSVIDDSIANIEQLRAQLCNARLALARCQATLADVWDEAVVRDEQLYAVRLELHQTAAELASETERVVAMAAQLGDADGMRAALESRLRCSEDRVEELTALMATVEQDRKKDKHAHTALTAQLADMHGQLEEQKARQREVGKAARQAEDRAVRLEGDVAIHEQKHVRLQSELQRERDERRREVERRRDTEAQLDQMRQHAASLEGQQEALTQSIQLRPAGVTDTEYERRLREKEALILRLGKTVKQMHRHIEVDVAQREAELARTIRQMQRLFVLVVKILSKPQYAADNDVRRLLEVLERESAAGTIPKAKDDLLDKPAQ